MAKLSKCRTCSETVSRRARHCPKCGEGRPGRRQISMKATGLLALLSIAFTGGMHGKQTAHVVSKQLTAWADQASQQEAKFASKIEPAAGGDE